MSSIFQLGALCDLAGLEDPKESENGSKAIAVPLPILLTIRQITLLTVDHFTAKAAIVFMLHDIAAGLGAKECGLLSR